MTPLTHRKRYSIRTICFKQWSRHKVAVLLSLSKAIKIGVLCLSYSLVNRTPVILAQSDTVTSHIKSLDIEEVEVTGRRSQTVLSGFSRLMTVIDKEEIEQAGVQHLNDLLEFVSNADVRQRGIAGVQADISIRGSSFDHVMVLVNGINLNDPQTGHLSMDLPIDIEAVKRIEVLEGPAARSLGPGAFMGAINIITQQGDSGNIVASEVIGEHGYRRDHIHAGLSTGLLHHFISASHATSDGYCQNTDFTLYNVYYRNSIKADKTIVDFQAGLQSKHFGASNFYSPKYPDQYEETTTWFGSLKASTGSIIEVTPAVYWRRKKDHYLLVRDDPGFYENFHLTDVYGSRLNLTYAHNWLTCVLGFDLRSENIMSNNIGFERTDPVPVRGEDSAYYTKQYGRTNFAAFQELILHIGKLRITSGARLNWNTCQYNKPAFVPGIDASFNVTSQLIAFAGINRAIHLPTFTDLFYVDPVSEGNLNLTSNYMISYEGGLRYMHGLNNMQIAVFHHTSPGMIDWLWSYASNRFSPVNLSGYETWGISSGLSVNMRNISLGKWFESVHIHYLFLDVHKSLADSVSKYSNLRHKLSVSLGQSVAGWLHFQWKISYQDRYGELIEYDVESGHYLSPPFQPFWLVDVTTTCHFHQVQFYIDVTNILNTRYVDAGSAYQPRRWIKAGVVFSLRH